MSREYPAWLAEFCEAQGMSQTGWLQDCFGSWHATLEVNDLHAEMYFNDLRLIVESGGILVEVVHRGQDVAQKFNYAIKAIMRWGDE